MRVRYITVTARIIDPTYGFNSRYAGKIHLAGLIFFCVVYHWFNSRYAGKIHRFLPLSLTSIIMVQFPLCG